MISAKHDATRVTIGKRIRKEMKRKGVSIRMLSEASQVHIGPIYGVLNGATSYTVDTLFNICKALKVSPKKVLP